MKAEIEAILSGLPVGRIETVGKFWQVSVGKLSGARENGISLAHELKRQYEYCKAREAFVSRPEPVEAVTPKESVPVGLADLIRENEPYGEAQARLWSLYVGLQNKLMLGIASEADARLHTRLHGYLAWISKGAAEVVR